MATINDREVRLRQRSSALKIANSRRSERAQLKRDIRSSGAAGRATVAGLLREPTELVYGMRVGQLLRSCRWVGAANARKLLKLAEVSSLDTPVGSLTPRQREILASQLDPPAS